MVVLVVGVVSGRVDVISGGVSVSQFIILFVGAVVASAETSAEHRKQFKVIQQCHFIVGLNLKDCIFTKLK